MNQSVDFSANLLRYTEEARHGSETAGWVESDFHGQGLGIFEVDEVTVDLIADLEWQAQESRIFSRS